MTGKRGGGELLDPRQQQWDNPTMAIARADAKKRVVIPGARPGDIFEIDSAGEGRYTLVRLERKLDRLRLSRDEAVRTISDYPLTPSLPWEELREVTREP